MYRNFILVEECKSAWKSLRDSMRYHISRAQKKKSGSQALDYEGDEELHNDDIEWEFAEDLMFLKSNSAESRKRYI